jgi:hypothetical protein
MSEERGVAWIPTRLHPGVEHELAELAAYHVGLFAGAASRLDGAAEMPAIVAHGLFLMAQEAERRRREWIGQDPAEAGIAL